MRKKRIGLLMFLFLVFIFAKIIFSDSPGNTGESRLNEEEEALLHDTLKADYI